MSINYCIITFVQNHVYFFWELKKSQSYLQFDVEMVFEINFSDGIIDPKLCLKPFIVSLKTKMSKGVKQSK